MTDEQLKKLESYIFEFFEANKHKSLNVKDVEAHIKSLGYEPTRPILDTLKVYGVAKRDITKGRKYLFPEKKDAWSVSVDDQLIPG